MTSAALTETQELATKATKVIKSLDGEMRMFLDSLCAIVYSLVGSQYNKPCAVKIDVMANSNENYPLLAVTVLIAMSLVLSSCHKAANPNSKYSEELNAKFEDRTESANFIQFPDLACPSRGTVGFWKGRPCYIFDQKIFLLNIKELKGEEYELPEQLNPIFMLQLSQENTLIGISAKASGPTLFYQDGDDWKEIPLSFKRDKDTRGMKIAVKKNKAFLLNTENAYSWDGRKWTKRPFNPRNQFKYPEKVLLGDNGTVFMANCGGGLGKYDTKTGALQEVTDRVGVDDMCFDDSGKLWFVASLEQMDYLIGRLYSLEDGKPVLHCQASNVESLQDSFDSLSVNKDGSILIGATHQGIFKFMNGKTVRLTPEWKYYEPITSEILVGNKVVFFAKQKGVAVVEIK